MSLFSRSYQRFTGGMGNQTTSESARTQPSQNRNSVPNEQNITHRKKLSAVSTSVHGDDGLVAASPRNSYHRNAPSFRRRDQIDGAAHSSTIRAETTPVERRAAEIRLKNSQEMNHAPPPPPIECSSSAQQENMASLHPPTNMKKPRSSSSSLASVFRSRASSPIEKMRKFIGRSSSSKSAIQKHSEGPNVEAVLEYQKAEKVLNDEIERLRKELRSVKVELDGTKSELRLREADVQQMMRIKLLQQEKVNSEQQCDVAKKCDVATMTSEEVAERAESSRSIESAKSDKENMNPHHHHHQEKVIAETPEIICLDEEVGETSKIKQLEEELAKKTLECEEQKEDFRRTRKDFILILKEAVLRKNEAEIMFNKIAKAVADDEDWAGLMSQNSHMARRNVLLMWAQKKLESYADRIEVSNFSSDWTDCRAFCALIYEISPDLMPDVVLSPIVGDCVTRCRLAFDKLEIPFEHRALGLADSANEDEDDNASACSSTNSCILPDWRYIMETVFLLYKRSILKK